jgi:hypothetical protein
MNAFGSDPERKRHGEGLTSQERSHHALIRYPRFKELLEDIQMHQQLSRFASEPQNISLEGDTGTGKTTLVKTYAQQFHRQEGPHGTLIPVLYLEMPSPATVKSVAATILRHMGDPGASRGTLWSMNERVIHFLKACAVQLVILDDFQHLYDSETDRVLERVSDWLKVLIKETGVPFLVVGLEGKVKIILEANPQLSRLFATREVLKPLAWDAADPQRQQDFALFVDYAEKAVGLPLSDEIPRMDMLTRLHYASGGGVIGNLMNLLRYSAQLAEKYSQPKLNLNVLSLAFTKCVQKHVASLGYGRNPFDTPAHEPFAALPSSPQPKIGGKKSKAGHRPNVRDVLSSSS